MPLKMEMKITPIWEAGHILSSLPFVEAGTSSHHYHLWRLAPPLITTICQIMKMVKVTRAFPVTVNNTLI